MSTHALSIRFASTADAEVIAELSRDEIEHGFAWRWTRERVARAIADPETNVIVAGPPGQLLGFGIMKYRDEEAHLLLFAVAAAHRRQGVGTTLLSWLETVAYEAGVIRIHVECRRNNAAARNFYGEQGYHETMISPGYYQGREDAIVLVKHRVPGPDALR